MAYEVSIQIPVVVVSYRVGFVHEKVRRKLNLITSRKDWEWVRWLGRTLCMDDGRLQDDLYLYTGN